MPKRSFKFIDLFAGIGGFHQAMTSLGGKCVFASDIDEDCRKTYEANYGIKPVGDITKIDVSAIPNDWDLMTKLKELCFLTFVEFWNTISQNMRCWRMSEI